MPNFYDDAAFYVGLGWKVFPCLPDLKAPAVKHGVKDATDDADLIAEWATRWPNANIGIACGASGLMVVDLDPRNGCWETLKKLESERRVFPLTVHAETRSKGLHLYFSLPQGLPEGWRRKLPGGIDIQVGNKYVLAPNSFVDGRKLPDPDTEVGHYRWIRAPIGPHLPPPPRWLMEMLKPPPLPKFTGKKAEGLVEKRVEGALKKITQTGKGGRNNELNKQAHLLGRMISENGLNPEMVEARLTEAALSVGLVASEVKATVRSGIRSGMRHAGGGR